MIDSPQDEIEKEIGVSVTERQNTAFSAEELIYCSSCSRTNAPNRAACIYCGFELQPSIASSALTDTEAQLEPWEKGFNVIALPPFSLDGDAALEIARLYGGDSEFVRSWADVTSPIPLARLASREAAESVVARLADCSLQCRVIPDEELDLTKPAARLGGMEFDGSDLLLWLFNTGDLLRVPFGRLGLLVSGNFVTSRVDSQHKKKSGKREVTIGEATTISTEPVLDIYLTGDSRTYRINSTGFDFSCLGSAKRLIVADNFNNIRRELAGRSPDLEIADQYDSLRPVITPVWDVTEQKESLGMKYAGFGQRAFSSSSSTNNRDQFTRYSRMMWYLHEKRSETAR